MCVAVALASHRARNLLCFAAFVFETEWRKSKNYSFEWIYLILLLRFSCNIRAFSLLSVLFARLLVCAWIICLFFFFVETWRLNVTQYDAASTSFGCRRGPSHICATRVACNQQCVSVSSFTRFYLFVFLSKFIYVCLKCDHTFVRLPANNCETLIRFAWKRNRIMVFSCRIVRLKCIVASFITKITIWSNSVSQLSSDFRYSNWN